eukprot:gene46210-64633_t
MPAGRDAAPPPRAARGAAARATQLRTPSNHAAGGGARGRGTGAPEPPKRLVQQHLTVTLGRPHGVDTSRPLLNPNACSEYESWHRLEPRHIHAVLRVTYADEDRRQCIGWTANIEDNLAWVVRFRRPMLGGGTAIGTSRNVPTFMLYENAEVDNWLTHNATTADWNTLQRGAPRHQWCAVSMAPFREAAAEAAAR